jgi:predicted PurR-regulated permease PerM
LTKALSSPGQHRTWLNDLLVVAGIAAALWITYRLGRVVLVLIFAMFLAYVIAPLVDRVQQVSVRGRTYRMPRGVAISIVYLLLVGTAVGSVMLLWPSAARQLDDAIASVPRYTDAFRTWERGWSRYYERLRIPLELRRGIDQSVLGAGDAAVAYTHGASLAAIDGLSNVLWLVLIPVLTFLLLKDGAGIRRTVLLALPHRFQLRVHLLFEELNNTLAAYVRAQLIACALVGTACGVGFALLGSPYPVLLAVLAAVLEFIPLIGPLVIGAVAVGIALLHDPMLALWTAAFLVALRVIEDYVVYPKLVGRTIDLHPLAIIVAVLAGAELGGGAGIFVAVPVVALVTVLGRHGLVWSGRNGEDAVSRQERQDELISYPSAVPEGTSASGVMPHDQPMKNVVRSVLILTACAFVLAPQPARADGFLVPWVGSAFGSNINSGQTTLGVSAGGMGGGILGGEVDFGWSPT